MKTILILCALALPLFLSGCAGLGQSNMSADQLKELAKDKSIGVMTNEVAGIWGTLKNKVVTVDKSVLVDGSVTVAPDGSVTITNKPKGTTMTIPPVTQIPVPVVIVPVVQ
ncbi:MAG: hypothetical protein ABI790_05385 [Betaproteobacteria bacterium]